VSFARWQPYYTDRELELDRRIHAFGLLLALIATPLLARDAAVETRDKLSRTNGTPRWYTRKRTKQERVRGRFAGDQRVSAYCQPATVLAIAREPRMQAETRRRRPSRRPLE
jgi:hypothetical protein